MIKWKLGRQNSGYYKLLIFGIFPYFDLHILKYPKGSYVEAHKDPINTDNKHYRLNIILKSAKYGGIFLCKNTIFKCGSVTIFRPDIEEHAVSRIEKGCRYVLSIGWSKRA